MNTNENARRLLFRALIGEEPLPRIEEINQARRLLADDHAAHAALDELLAVIAHTDRAPQEQWYELLHAYAAAQLAGYGETAEFATVRRLLDGNVTLAEEYALLYETLRAEAVGQLSRPMEIPPADLSFLPPSKRVGWLARLLPQRTPSLAGVVQLFQQMERAQQLATAAVVALALFIGAWATDFTWQRSTTPDNAPDQPISTALSKNDPFPLEESLKRWSAGKNTHPVFIEKQSTTLCNAEGSANGHKECPM